MFFMETSMPIKNLYFYERIIKVIKKWLYAHLQTTSASTSTQKQWSVSKARDVNRDSLCASTSAELGICRVRPLSSCCFSSHLLKITPSLTPTARNKTTTTANIFTSGWVLTISVCSSYRESLQVECRYRSTCSPERGHLCVCGLCEIRVWKVVCQCVGGFKALCVLYEMFWLGFSVSGLHRFKFYN